MVTKDPIMTQRVRKVPKQFSWVDQRLVRERRIAGCTVQGAALYLFLVTVADARGLSFYADATIAHYLGLDVAELEPARTSLIDADLLAYKKPLYQVLSLDTHIAVARTSMDRPISLGDILKRAMEVKP